MSFENFIEKEINKNFYISFIAFIIISLVIGLIIYLGIMKNNKNDCIEFTESEYKNVFYLEDNSWFILDRENQEYIFQPVELGDWDYELDTEKELKKILATYFINKYDIEEHRAIQEVENILKEIK